ncbi:MAG: metallopeptidase TldD-related protein [Romboutsia sp.]
MIKEEIIVLLDKLILKMNENKVDDVCIYLSNNNGVNINIYESEVDKLSIYDENLIFVEGNYNGYLGYTYIGKLEEDLFIEYVKNIIETSKVNNIVFDKVNFVENIKNENEYSFKEYHEIIDDLKNIETYILNLNKNIKRVMECSYSHNVNKIMLKNNKGIEMVDCSHYVYSGIEVAVKDGVKVENNHAFKIDKSFDNINLKEIADEAVSEALDKLIITNIETGNYPVILRNNVVAEMIASYIPIFGGDRIVKDLTLLKGKLGRKIATSKLNIIESPMLECGLVSRTFDDEGTKTFDKFIIEDGILKNILMNNEIAKLHGESSTGNGFKKIYKENVSISTTNLYIKEGKSTLKEMISRIEEGIMITNIQGLHAGINTVSGDFSISSGGYLIKNGKKDKYIGHVTVAGNIYEMLNNIDEIGCELKSTSIHSNFVLAPSLKINKLTITV